MSDHKASNNSHFRIPLIFILYFPSQFQRFSSLFDTFSHLRNLGKLVHRRLTIPQGQQVPSTQRS